MPRSAKELETPWERFPYSVLPVSTVAEQCYCEHRVHLWLASPSSMVSVPRKLEQAQGPARLLVSAAKAGTHFHARVAEGAAQVAPTALQQLVASGTPLQLLEWPLESRYGSLPIAGIPDAVCVEGGQVRCVLDYKLTDSNQLQMSHRVQLQLYGWLLEKSRLALTNTLCVSVLVPTEHAELIDSVDEKTRQELAFRLHRQAQDVVDSSPTRINWYVKRHDLGDGLWVRLRIFHYDRNVALRELRYFARYWRGDRAPVPSKNIRKCRVCLYNSLGLCLAAATSYAGET